MEKSNIVVLGIKRIGSKETDWTRRGTSMIAFLREGRRGKTVTPSAMLRPSQPLPLIPYRGSYRRAEEERRMEVQREKEEGRKACG